MTIYVDADACPVVKIVEKVAMNFSVPVVLLCDTSHYLTSEYSKVIVIGAGSDAVDLALINRASKGDIVVTQDYGVAALALGKGAFAIHQSGKVFTDENINGLLMDRHLAKKSRMSKAKNHIKGPGKRTRDDDFIFEKSFRDLVKKVIY